MGRINVFLLPLFFCVALPFEAGAQGTITTIAGGPTISGQRVTTLDWTKPKRRNAVRPICGMRSPIARGSPPRGRS